MDTTQDPDGHYIPGISVNPGVSGSYEVYSFASTRHSPNTDVATHVTRIYAPAAANVVAGDAGLATMHSLDMMISGYLEDAP